MELKDDKIIDWLNKNDVIVMYSNLFEFNDQYYKRLYLRLFVVKLQSYKIGL